MSSCVVRQTRSSRLVIAICVFSLATGLARAQTPSDDRVREVMRQALQQTQGGVARAGGPLVDLAIDEAVRLALEKNLDLVVERLNPQTIDLQLAAYQAIYRPTLTTFFSQNNQEQLPTSQLIGTSGVLNRQTSYDLGLLQNLRWGGGNFGISWTNRRQDSTSAFNTFNPQFNSAFRMTYTQPLLRNFRTDTTRTQLRVTSINREVSDIQLRARVTNTLSDVRNAYWDLVYAVQALDVARRSLTLAERLVEDNRARVEVGTLAPIDIVQSQAEAASRRQTVAQAGATHRSAELVLKRLIVSGTDDPLWPATINPVDRPTFQQPEAIDLEAAIRNALANRTDLAQSRKQLESNDLNVRYLQNQTLPALDLAADYRLQGIGGTQFIRGSSLGGTVLEKIQGGYGDALASVFGNDYPTWTLSLNFSYPIGQTAADANYARAKVQVQQTQAQIRQLELTVATQVTDIALQIESTLKRLEAASAARELTVKQLEAETSKFEVGMTTNFFVVQAQRDLADAENIELRALLDYRKALVDFERVQQTAASSAGITTVSGSGPGASTTRTTGGGGS